MRTMVWAFLLAMACGVGALGWAGPTRLDSSAGDRVSLFGGAQQIDSVQAINQSLLDDSDQDVQEQACKPDGAACRNGDRCCGYCCSKQCRKHANCKD